MSRSPRFRTGDLVEVRSCEEILATLDANGCIDGMPFMPEMLRHCGQRLRVSKVAHKTCDTVNKTGGRRLEAAVHLGDLRCDGAAHGGCQASCLLFWKTAWLRKVDEGEQQDRAGVNPAVCTEYDLQRFARRRDLDSAKLRYRCQATQLPEATTLLQWWDARQYIADVTSGNESAARVLKLLMLSWFRALTRLGFAYRITVRLHDFVHGLLIRRPPPYGDGTIAHGVQTPAGDFGLQPGEQVRVKTHQEILATVNKEHKNRGMRFDEEMVSYCGKEFRVARRVEKIIDEVSGEMIQMKNPCIVLDGVVCRSEYSAHRLLCPRAIVPYWREIWLQRDSTPENE